MIDYSLPTFRKYSTVLSKNGLQFPYIIERYLNGVRCYISNTNDKITIFNSKNEIVEHCEHISNHPIVKKFFETYPNSIIEGELYTEKYKKDFSKLLKKKSLSTDEIKKIDEIVFYCHDIFIPEKKEMGFVDRKNIILGVVGETPKSEEDNFDLFCIGGIYFIDGNFKCVSVNSMEEMNISINLMKDKDYEGILLKTLGEYAMGKKSQHIKLDF